jgi:SAM-dependent methyltransferase
MAYLDLVLEEIYRVLLPDGHFFVSVPNEGGLAWTLGRRITTARQFNSATLNYERVIEIDHINCIWQVEKALKRYFHTVKRVLFPFRLPSFQANLITTYHLSKRMERLVHSVA